MKQLIVIFEFRESNSSRLISFYDMLRKYGTYAFVTNNSCIIWTNDNVAVVRDNLKTGIGPNDKIFVAVIAAPAAWVTSVAQEVTEYLHKNLK